MITEFPRVRSAIESCMGQHVLPTPPELAFVEQTIELAGRHARRWLVTKSLPRETGIERADSRFWTLRTLQRCLINSLLHAFQILPEESATWESLNNPPVSPVDVRMAILVHIQMGLDESWNGHVG